MTKILTALTFAVALGLSIASASAMEDTVSITDVPNVNEHVRR